MIFQKFTFVLGAIFLITSETYASTINDAKLTRVYVQSTNGTLKSEAHAISVNKDLDPSCNYRLHINPQDKELFSAVLAYKLADRSFDLMYQTGVESKSVAGHLESSCKLFSVY